MISPETFESLSAISLAGFFLVFLAGLVMAFNPRSLMVVPVLVGYLAGRRDADGPGGAFAGTLSFALGMTAADVFLGVLFAYAGRNAGEVFGARWELLIAAVLVLLGLRWLNLIRFRTVGFHPRPGPVRGHVGAFLLGIPFSLSFCPFCVPVLLSILTVAAATGRVWYSAVLMLFFSLGRAVPLLAAGVSMGHLKRLEAARRHIPVIEKAGGLILLGFGIYYLYDFLRLYG